MMKRRFWATTDGSAAWMRQSVMVVGAACALVGWASWGGVRGLLATAAVAAAGTALIALGVRALRQVAAQAERTASAAVAAAEQAARAQEQERHQRILHDRVLQVLEMLARGERRFDTGVRGEVALEAAWLRNLVETGREREPGNIVGELEGLALGFAARGLRVEVNTASLAAAGNPQDALAPAQVAALVEATREALTNVVKHAGTDVATVRVTYGPTGLTVTVVDAGVGFEGEPESGSGLRRSIIGRLTEVGGSVLIESAAGEGTSIELRLPFP